MERERLTGLLSTTARVDGQDLAGLKELSERYPWFSGAHLLLAMGEHNEGDVLFDERLRKTAVHIPSRAVLFDKVVPVKATVPMQQPAALPNAEETSRKITAPVIEPVRSAPDGPIASERPEVSAEREVISGRDTPVSEEKDPSPVPERIAEGPDPVLDRQFLEAALASGFQLAPLDHIGSATPVPPPAPQLPVLDRPKVIPPDSRLRFTDWLAASPQAEGRGAEVLGTKAPVRTDGVDQATIIDRFIQNELPEPPKKVPFFSPQVAAKRSLEDRAGLVTETLARIYEQQGDLAKAAKTYRELALKYPAKSVYFAALEKALDERQRK